MAGSDSDEQLANALTRREWTLVTAESVTAGSVATRLSDIEGSGEWFAGGVVAYSSDVKFDVLDVPRGPVISESAALAMARGVCRALGADVAIATTGCAGPESMEGQPVGRVWIAVACPATGFGRAELLDLDGGPAQIRDAAVEACIALAADCVSDAVSGPRARSGAAV